MPWAAQPATEEGQRTRIMEVEKRWESGAELVYGVFDPEERAVLGGCSLHNRNGPGVLEIGYWIAAAHTRRGYATELARALTAAALEIPEVARVEIHCDAANIASAAVPRRLGYTLTSVEDRPKDSPAASGRFMSWALRRGQLE